MAYLEITGLPMRSSGGDFGLTINIELERERGLSVLSDDGVLPRVLVESVTGTVNFSGEIFLNGIRIDPLPSQKRSIAFLGDVPGVIPNRTVRENLDMALATRETSVSEDVFLVDQELTEGPLAGLGDTQARLLDDSTRTFLAAARLLLAGCDLLIIRQLPVPGFVTGNGVACWNPVMQLDSLLELKNLLRRFRATWINTLTDPACVHLLSDRLVIFADNSLMQEGSLRECINVPASRMVADFLAYPRMNYRTVRVERDGPFMMLRSGRYGFSVSEYIKRYIGSREGEEVIMGVRPEDLGLRPYETGDPTVLNLAKVMRVDSVPGAQVIRIDAEGDEWLALVDTSRPMYTGQLVELRPDPDNIRIFHPVNGAYLLD